MQLFNADENEDDRNDQCGADWYTDTNTMNSYLCFLIAICCQLSINKQGMTIFATMGQ